MHEKEPFLVTIRKILRRCWHRLTVHPDTDRLHGLQEEVGYAMSYYEDKFRLICQSPDESTDIAEYTISTMDGYRRAFKKYTEGG